MALTLEEIRERIKNPSKKEVIHEGVKHEKRLRFHVEPFMKASDISGPLTDFLEWVKTLIPKDKYNIFLSLFQFPSPNVKLTGQIFNELERVFDGRNPAASYQFEDSKFRDDWEYYRQEKLQEPEVWRRKGWEHVKSGINSVLVVDLPAEQMTDLPEPYFYFLPFCEVLDFEINDDGQLIFIMFKQDGNKIAVYDDTFYRVIQLDEKREILSIIERPHELGYCPAAFFWTTELTNQTRGIKKSPLSANLSDLDWLLFFSISKKHLDLYAPYPIYSAYEADCDFMNNQTGDYCDGGYLRDSNQHYRVLRNGSLDACPVCAKKRFAGVGALIEVPAPKSKEDPDLRNPVQLTTVDVNSLKYNVDEVKRLANEIFISVVGLGGETQVKESLNELQVTANFESRTNVLNSIKGNIEKAIMFANKTACKLRYGAQFLHCSESMGTEYYIYKISDLYAQYKQAKENGASEAELDAINDRIIETEHRNNPTQLQRMLILKHLEPYRHYTFDELMKLSDKNLLDPEELNVKINFNTFVDRFERENGSITEFGIKMEFKDKVNLITNEFKNYGKERKEVGKVVG